MKLFFETLIVFFGTLMAAGLVALGEPAGAELDMAQAASAAYASVGKAQRTTAAAARPVETSIVAWLGKR